MKELKDSQFPSVSVIVVSYNSEKYISQCLESIIKSDYPQLEIIVVDNASKDNSLQILDKFQKNITTIKNKKNLGFAGGNNICIKKSSGEIIALINPDAYVTKNTITELVKPFLDDENVMITGSKVLYPDSKKIQSAGGIIQKNGLTNHIGYQENDEHQYDDIIQVDYVTGSAMAIRRKLFEITGLLDTVYTPAYYEEAEKCVQARKLNYKVLYVPSSVVFHYESTTYGALTINFLKIFHLSRFKFIYRNYSIGEFLFKFIPSELKWFLYHCDSKKIVVNAHLKVLFSPQIKFKKRIELKN